jgi:hypothetical protein
MGRACSTNGEEECIVLSCRLILNMEAICFSETSVSVYKTTWCHNPRTTVFTLFQQFIKAISYKEYSTRHKVIF